jgi:methylenetetrahydrofolate reductase (NADPH)
MGSVRAGSFSFEYFPPRTPEQQERLAATRATLAALGPDYVSVTFGAGGSTREHTYETVAHIHAQDGCPVAPHISCIGAGRAEVDALLERYRALGIRRLVTLRGDPPSGMGGGVPGDFRYAADLVAHIRAQHGDAFHIEVAAYPEMHPQAPTAAADREAFRRKVAAGADGAITQYFYNADAYLDFRDWAAGEGIGIPIVPGIMPITNYAQLARFSDACGAEIPRWIRTRLEGFGDDLESLRAFGHDVVARLCTRLLEEGAPGLHFYTLNRAGPAARLWRELGLGAP